MGPLRSRMARLMCPLRVELVGSRKITLLLLEESLERQAPPGLTVPLGQREEEPVGVQDQLEWEGPVGMGQIRLGIFCFLLN